MDTETKLSFIQDTLERAKRSCDTNIFKGKAFPFLVIIVPTSEPMLPMIYSFWVALNDESNKIEYYKSAVGETDVLLSNHDGRGIYDQIKELLEIDKAKAYFPVDADADGQDIEILKQCRIQFTRLVSLD